MLDKRWILRLPGVRSAWGRLVATRQERSAARELKAYRKRARDLGVGDERQGVARRVADRLAARGLHRQPGRMGDLRIFLAYPLANWEAVLPRELAAFGEVVEFEWRGLGFDDAAADWDRTRDRMNAAMMDAFRSANRSRRVDVVVGYLSGNNTAPEIVRTMGREGAVTLNFCWDDKLHYRGGERFGAPRGPAALASAFDLNLTNAPESVLKYTVDGGIAMFWPEAASPDVHRPYPCAFEFDVSFVGQRYGWRPRLVESLERAGVRVATFGSGWPGGRLSDEEMVRLYSRSRINLGFGGVGYSRRLLCLKGRDFEVPMSGGLYLTQHNPELELVYRIGEEIVTYRDEPDCLRAVRRLLSHPDAAERIRNAGRQRALRDHTWRTRFEQAFSAAGVLVS